MSQALKIVLALSAALAGAAPAEVKQVETYDEYRGIWYAVQDRSNNMIKYSGGLSTYPQQIRPFAVYSEKANKTFFCYGGTDAQNSTLLHMVSYFDHETGTVPRPRVLLDKQTRDAHDNPSIAMDDQGHIWIFSNSHGAGRPSYIHRSKRPHDIDAFELMWEGNISYGQPWFIPGEGFVLIHNRYQDGRAVAFSTSRDGQEWSEPKLLAQINGQYQVSVAQSNRVAVFFNYFPNGLNSRTNAYYVESSDFGRTWTNVKGEVLDLPLREAQNPALVRDYEAEGLMLYLKDVRFDAEGHPVLLYMTTRGYAAIPDNDPRIWTIARWDGDQWQFHEVTRSDHNYDYGDLYIEADGTWRIIGATETGPQPYMTGGEMAMWTSTDQGRTWTKVRQMTSGSPRNHTYSRQPVNAHPDFYAFWADGNANEQSESRLYFANKAGDVRCLPTKMTEDHQMPEPVHRGE